MMPLNWYIKALSSIDQNTAGLTFFYFFLRVKQIRGSREKIKMKLWFTLILKVTPDCAEEILFLLSKYFLCINLCIIYSSFVTLDFKH